MIQPIIPCWRGKLQIWYNFTYYFRFKCHTWSCYSKIVRIVEKIVKLYGSSFCLNYLFTFLN